MPRSLRDRTAVVTGAGSGIGRALCLQLAQLGTGIACADVDADTAEHTAALVREHGARAIAVPCDVRDLAQVQALADTAADELGPVDLVVNNAGIGAGGRRIGEEPMATWQRTLDVNLWGVINGCHVFTPRLRALGRGGIINLASAAGFAAAPGMGPYNASKAAVLSLSETLAAELADTPITVTVVCPTFVRTNIVSDGDIEPGGRAAAERMMALTGRSADRIAATILRRHAAGDTYVVPQVEAKAVWALKRHAPRTYLAAGRAANRLLGIGRVDGELTVVVPDAPPTPTTAPDHEEIV